MYSFAHVAACCEVVERLGVRQARRKRLAGGQCDRQLRRPQLEVVAPFALWIEAKRDRGEQMAVRVGVGEFKDVLARQQAARGEFGERVVEYLKAQRERCRVASREVRAHRRTRGRPRGTPAGGG